MNKKIIGNLWGMSLIVIGIICIIMGVTSLADIAVSDWARRLLGIVDMIMLAIAAYTSVKLFWKK